MKKLKRVVILANGLFPRLQRSLDVLNAADIIICCDGAADKLVRFGLSPHAIVGDLDSVSQELRKRYASILIHSEDQENNDLTKAVHYCIEKKYTAVTILGATGLREDHTLGNVSLMLEYHPRIKVQIISDFGCFFLVQSGEKIASHAGEKISFFSVDNRIKVTSRGLKYPLNDTTLSNWYKATLNEALSDHFILNYDSDRPLIAYKAW